MSNFISAHELIETNTISNVSNEYESADQTEDNIQRYIKKSKIKNTDACTQKWVRILQNYRKKKNISYDIQTIANQEQLEHELCEFFADITRYDKKPYKVESIISAYTSLKRFLFEASVIQSVNINDRYRFPILYKVVDGKCMELQDQGY
ncbi:2141_t:CDS:1, partial [Cetraspora pellucida]